VLLFAPQVAKRQFHRLPIEVQSISNVRGGEKLPGSNGFWGYLHIPPLRHEVASKSEVVRSYLQASV